MQYMVTFLLHGVATQAQRYLLATEKQQENMIRLRVEINILYDHIIMPQYNI